MNLEEVSTFLGEEDGFDDQTMDKMGILSSSQSDVIPNRRHVSQELVLNQIKSSNASKQAHSKLKGCRKSHRKLLRFLEGLFLNEDFQNNCFGFVKYDNVS